MAWCDVVEPRTLRACRIALGQSQAAFAAMLGASPESYRTWDAGRRATPPKVLARARALATHRDDHELLPLSVLALLIGVHVKTLRAAARDGRLPVTYDTRTTFRHLPSPRDSRRGQGVSAVVLWAIGGAGGPPCAIDVGQCARRLRRADSRATSRTRVEPGAIGHAGGRGAEGRRLSMGGAETHAVARVLATHHRAPPVSVAQATSGDDHLPLGGGTNAGRELERQRDPRVARGHPTGRPSAAGLAHGVHGRRAPGL